MPEDRRQTCPKFDHQLEQAFISNKALTNTFLALVQTFAMPVMFSGEDCSIDIMDVLVRSKLSYANKLQKEALKNTFLTLVGPHFFMAFTVFYAHCTSKPSNAR